VFYNFRRIFSKHSFETVAEKFLWQRGKTKRCLVLLLSDYDKLILNFSLNGGRDSQQGINWAIPTQRYYCLISVPSRLTEAQSLKPKCSVGLYKKDTFYSVRCKSYLGGFERRYKLKNV